MLDYDFIVDATLTNQIAMRSIFSANQVLERLVVVLIKAPWFLYIHQSSVDYW